MSLGSALGWYYSPNAAGIFTRADDIVNWPDALGPEPTGTALQTILDEYDLWNAKETAIAAINDLRDEKRNLPILSQGYTVQTGVQNIGAMATDMFAGSKNTAVVTSLTSSGNVAILTFDKPHRKKNGVSFPVSGADQPEYNIIAVATVINPFMLSYPIVGPAVSPATGAIVCDAPTFKWVDNDNNIVYWTQDEVSEIVQACAEYLDECTLHGVELKNEARGCDTVAEIEAIDITAGWPETGI